MEISKFKTLLDKADIIGQLLAIFGTLSGTVGIGAIGFGGTTNGLSFAYVAHPKLLKLGLILVVAGFIFQFLDSLIVRHNVQRREAVYWACILGAILLSVSAMFL